MRADPPPDERLQDLEQRLSRAETRLDDLAGAQQRLAAALEQNRGLRVTAAADEQARVARVRAVDGLLAAATLADQELMAGGRPDASLAGLSREVTDLAADAGARSGRLEYERYVGAAQALAAARGALAEGDWWRARNDLSAAALELAGAREAAAGNPNRAAVGR